MAFKTQEIVLFSKTEKEKIKNDIIEEFNGASATPIASLSVLLSTYPNGANGIYVALDSGLWYGWNGSSWVSGGTYQATGVGIGEVTTEKLSDNSVTESKVVDNSITESKLGAKSVTVEKLGDDVNHQLHALRQELINLKEEIYGTILDATTTTITDSGIIPSTVNVEGTDYNVLPHGDVTVLNVEGDTVRCENLLRINLAYNSASGVTLTESNGVITLSGTTTSPLNVNVGSATLPSGTYYIKDFSTKDGVYVYANSASANWARNNTFTLSETTTINFTIETTADNNVNGVILKPMLVRGDVAPTEFQPYFEGLKPTEYKSVDVSSPNLLNIQDRDITANGVTLTESNGAITLSGTTTSSLNVNVGSATLPSGTYYIKDFSTKDGVYVYANSASANWARNNTFTLSETKTIIFTIETTADNNVNGVILKPMLVKGSVAPTTYIPYYNKPLLTYPTTLNGVEGSRDTLEVRFNSTTDLYDVYKVTRVSISGDEITPLQTPTEELVQSNLTFENVTTLAHTNSNVKIVNTNDVYGNKPKTTLGLVYKKTATR